MKELRQMLDDAQLILVGTRVYVNRLFSGAELNEWAELDDDRLSGAIGAATALGRLVRRGKKYRRPLVGEDLPSIGDRLRYLREIAGLTQTEAALRAGMTQSQWADIEGDRRTPMQQTLHRVAAAIGCEPRDLV